MVSLQDMVGKNYTKAYPNFGPYGKDKRAEIAKLNSERTDLLGDNKEATENRPANFPDKKVPSVADVIGRALDYIGTYNDLDNRYGPF